MVKIELNAVQLTRAIRQLPEREKLKLFEQLRQETWAKHWDDLLRRIDQRRKKYKISMRDISKEIEKARQEYYERRH